MKIRYKKLLNGCLISTLSMTILSLASLSSAEIISEKTAIELKENQFITLTFHDVRDDVDGKVDRDVYAISTKNLAEYFAWIKKEGWQPIRLKDVWEARQKQRDLPAKSVFLTFDDGALSSYSKIFPLLKQYGLPAVFAIPTSWINGNTQAAYEAYGEGNLMNWDQMREMQKSGLVEFVSHSDNLHHGIQANPQNNMQPAAIVREYFPLQKRYETDAEYKTRIVNDLTKSKHILDHELGINTQAIFWPYGAVTPESEDLALQAGLPMSFSLGSVASLADSVQTYQRALIMNNPNPEQIHQLMDDFVENSRAPFKQRKSFLRVNPQDFYASSIQESDEKLGRMLDRIQALKSNTLLIPTVHDSNADGRYDLAYFPNTQLIHQQDMINRIVWQSRTRINNRVYAELPIKLELDQGIPLAVMTANLVKNNSSLEGLVIDTQNTLSCALQQLQWTPRCEEKLQKVLSIKEQTKKQAKYYANISNNYQTALKFELNTHSLDGLPQLISRSLNNSDFVYLNLDPIQYPKVLDALLEQIKSMNSLQIQRLIVSLDVHEEMTEKLWNKYQQSYQKLRTASVQKIGINNYTFGQAQQVHQNLYQSLSLNDSPLTYRNPYNPEVNK